MYNTVLTDRNAIEVRGVSGAVVIANNALYSRSGSAISLISGNTGLVTLAGNVGSGGVSGGNTGYHDENGIAADFINGHFTGALPIDVFPAVRSALIAAGSFSHVADADFNGSPRQGTADVGAYRFDDSGNPGWDLSSSFKELFGSCYPT